MELNFGQINFYKSYNVIIYLLFMLTPSIAFLCIYDFTLIEKLETGKLLLISIGMSGFLYSIDFVMCGIFMTTMLNLSGRDDIDTSGDGLQLDGGSSLAFIVFGLSNMVTVANLLYLKFYLKEAAKFLLLGSLETWLLAQLIIITSCILTAVILYRLRRKEWKTTRTFKKMKKQFPPKV